MKKLLTLFAILFIFSINEVKAQTAVTIKDSVVVKNNYTSTKPAFYLKKGTVIQSRGNNIGDWTLFSKGWIKNSDVVFINEDAEMIRLKTSPTSDYASSLLKKAPEDLTEKEIAYLMLNERRKDESIRSDLTTIKNIQVFAAVLTVIGIIGSLLIAN